MKRETDYPRAAQYWQDFAGKYIGPDGSVNAFDFDMAVEGEFGRDCQRLAMLAIAQAGKLYDLNTIIETKKAWGPAKCYGSPIFPKPHTCIDLVNIPNSPAGVDAKFVDEMTIGTREGFFAQLVKRAAVDIFNAETIAFSIPMCLTECGCRLASNAYPKCDV
jgi:hypothetical protein